MNTLKNSYHIYKSIFLVLLISLYVFAENDDEPSTFVFPTYYHTYGIRKAGAFELFLFLGFKVNFTQPEGLACVRLDAWEDPQDPHDDDEVTVYGVNSGENNIIYNKSMYGLEVYGIGEEDYQLLNRPHGICANSRGDVYVADTGNHRIVRLFNPGNKLEYVASIGGQGIGDGHFISPQQVALDNSGNIYVSDSGNSRIQVFDKNNNFKFNFNNNNRLLRPVGITVTDSLQRFQGRMDNFIIVIDSSNQRINQFKLSGKLIKSITMPQIGFSDANLEYPCLDYYNQLLITDSKNHCIHKFDHNLNYITSFGSKGDNDHQFLVPKGITIYRRFGQLFIAESTGAQYYWVGTDFSIQDIVDQNNYMNFNIFITEPSHITADIFDKDRKFITRIANRRTFRSAGEIKLKWNKRVGRFSEEFYKENNYTAFALSKPFSKVSQGDYILIIKSEATYSSRSYFEKIKEKRFKLK